MPVDAIIPTFINAPDDVSEPAYDAEELRRALGGLVASGASATVSRSGVLDPRALVPSLSGSNVQVSAGPCVVGTSKGAYLSGAASVVTVDALVAADATNPRRDRLVFEVLDPDNGGSTARKARFRVITGTPSATALSGGGYPAAPGAPDGVSAFFDIADIDVPKSGNGSPTVTDKRPFSAASGAPVHVRNAAERDDLAKWVGRRVVRLDRGGALDVCDGTNWTDGDTGWVASSTYGNGFTPYMLSGYDGIKARLVNGTVHISGAAINAGAWGADIAICNFPAPFRPSRAIVGMNCVISAAGDVVVKAAGNNTTTTVFASFPIG